MPLEVPGTQQLLNISQSSGEADVHIDSKYRLCTMPSKHRTYFFPQLPQNKVKQNTPTMCFSGQHVLLKIWKDREGGYVIETQMSSSRIIRHSFVLQIFCVLHILCALGISLSSLVFPLSPKFLLISNANQINCLFYSVSYSSSSESSVGCIMPIHVEEGNLSSLQIQTLISSRNTLIDTPRNNV